MKKVVVLLVAAFLLALSFQPAFAAIADGGIDDNGWGTFLFESRTWLDLDNFPTIANWQSKVDTVIDAGYTLATTSDINAFLSDPAASPSDAAKFDAIAAMMGSRENGELIWGVFDDGLGPYFGSMLARRTSGAIRGWQVFDNDFHDPYGWDFRSGVFAFKEGTPAVPIPSTITLLGLGLLGLAGARRKKG